MRRYEHLLIFGFILASTVLVITISLRMVRLESESAAPLPSKVPPVPLAIKINLQSPEDLAGWNRHSFHGDAQFEIIQEADGTPSLRAVSRGTSSAIFKPVSVALADQPFLAWQWRITRFPTGKKNTAFGAHADSDFAARVSVIFKSVLPLQQDIVQYVWDDHFPEGTQGENPSWKKIKIIVVRSGKPQDPAGWVSEKRDIVKDYTQLFGHPPEKDIEAVGVMADSDDTQSETEAYFRNLAIETLHEEKPGPEPHRKRRLRLRFHLPFTPVFEKTKNVVKTVIEIPAEKIPKAVVSTTKKVVSRAVPHKGESK